MTRVRNIPYPSINLRGQCYTSGRAQANVQGTPVWPRTPSLLALWYHSNAQRLVLVTERSCRGLELGRWFDCGIQSLKWMIGQAPVYSG